MPIFSSFAGSFTGLGMRIGAGGQRLLTNLSMFLDFGSTACYPGTGTVVTDTVNNTTATVNGAVFSNTEGGYFEFTNDSIDFTSANSTNYNFTNNFTIELWVYINSFNNIGGVVTFGTDSGEQYAVFTDNSGHLIFGTGWPGTWYKVATGALGTAAWHQATVTFSNGSVIWYIDGAFSASQTIAPTSLGTVSTPYFGLGCNFPGGDEYYDGRIGLVALYNRVLTANEVNQNFIASRTKYGI
jgi:hypothetical protein